MSSTKQDWTPEPWQWMGVWPDTAGWEGVCIRGGDDSEVLDFAAYEGFSIKERDARRTVACVNALAGIPDPAAYLKERADYIERLEAVVRAGDDLAKRAEQTGRLIHDLAGCSLSSLHANDVAVRPMETSRAAYDAARSRVNLSTQTDADDNGTERKGKTE